MGSPGPQPTSALDEEFRRAMRGFASTVCVVSAPTPEGPRGMTATAVMSLSMDPPSLAVAMNRQSTLNPHLAEGALVSVHFLNETQVDLARTFAGGLPPDERFSVGAWSFDDRACPILPDAAASLSCAVEHRVELSTHTLLALRVTAVRLSPRARPLLYADGAYTGLRPDARSVAA